MFVTAGGGATTLTIRPRNSPNVVDAFDMANPPSIAPPITEAIPPIADRAVDNAIPPPPWSKVSTPCRRCWSDGGGALLSE